MTGKESLGLGEAKCAILSLSPQPFSLLYSEKKSHSTWVSWISELPHNRKSLVLIYERFLLTFTMSTVQVESSCWGNLFQGHTFTPGFQNSISLSTLGSDFQLTGYRACSKMHGHLDIVWVFSFMAQSSYAEITRSVKYLTKDLFSSNCQISFEGSNFPSS